MICFLVIRFIEYRIFICMIQRKNIICMWGMSFCGRNSLFHSSIECCANVDRSKWVRCFAFTNEKMSKIGVKGDTVMFCRQMQPVFRQLSGHLLSCYKNKMMLVYYTCYTGPSTERRVISTCYGDSKYLHRYGINMPIPHQ